MPSQTFLAGPRLLDECLIRRSRNHHSLTFQIPAARNDIYKGSFFPQTIRNWNNLPDLIITSAENAEDGVARFTSLVRIRIFTVDTSIDIMTFIHQDL